MQDTKPRSLSSLSALPDRCRSLLGVWEQWNETNADQTCIIAHCALLATHRRLRASRIPEIQQKDSRFRPSPQGNLLASRETVSLRGSERRPAASSCWCLTVAIGCRRHGQRNQFGNVDRVHPHNPIRHGIARRGWWRRRRASPTTRLSPTSLNRPGKSSATSSLT